MRRCHSFPKYGLLKSPVALIATRMARLSQPFQTTAAREYSCLPPVFLSGLRRPGRTIVSRAPSKVPRRPLITEVEANIDSTSSTFPTFAFAFDIDGVLLRSSKPLPGATEALLYLQKHNIPFILLTNGGGKLESERVAELSERLGVTLLEDNFVQSHTPFKGLLDPTNPGYVEGLKDKVVMVTGGDGDKCRQVAESYGFKHVVTPGDIVMACPDIWPFSTNFTDTYKASCRPLPVPINPTDPANSLKIGAIFVFNDPRDWALDTQIIIDLLLSREGILGTVSDRNGREEERNRGYQRDSQPKIYFSNPDLLWSSAYHIPRLGQGAFQEALIRVWTRVTGVRMKRTVIGKPTGRTYRYAQEVLLAHREKLITAAGTSGASPLSRVFMIGDNPASDINGANRITTPIPWTGILVKTGVFQEGTKPEFEPKATVDNVLDAVKWAFKEEGWKDHVGNDEL